MMLLDYSLKSNGASRKKMLVVLNSKSQLKNNVTLIVQSLEQLDCM